MGYREREEEEGGDTGMRGIHRGGKERREIYKGEGEGEGTYRKIQKRKYEGRYRAKDGRDIQRGGYIQRIKRKEGLNKRKITSVSSIVVCTLYIVLAYF